MLNQLAGQVARHLVLRMSLFVGFALAVSIAGPLMREHVHQANAVEDTVLLPIWDAQDVAAFPECVSTARWDRETEPRTLVVHRFDSGRDVRMRFGTSWKRNHDRSESNDVWVLGACH